MPLVTMRELLEAGVHYGHHTSRWNPKMKPYIYKARHSIHVVDLRQTVRGLVRARRFLTSIAEQGGEVILVGTKKQARSTIEDQAKHGGCHYVSERWLGGTLTNFNIILNRVARLKELEALDETGEIENRGKKYAAVLRREKAKLLKNLGGIREMKRMPDAMILIDPRREKNAMREALLLDIPIIAFLDTDADPDNIDIPIPGNDEAMRSIRLICTKLMDAVLEGKANRPMPAEETAETADAAPAADAEPVPAQPEAAPEEPPPDADAPAEQPQGAEPVA